MHGLDLVTLYIYNADPIAWQYRVECAANVLYIAAVPCFRYVMCMAWHLNSDSEAES